MRAEAAEQEQGGINRGKRRQKQGVLQAMGSIEQGKMAFEVWCKQDKGAR